MTGSTVQKGARVRFKAKRLGTATTRDAVRFAEHIVWWGDEGVYDGPHPNARLAEQGWHICTVEHEGETLYVPVHPSHFEVIA